MRSIPFRFARVGVKNRLNGLIEELRDAKGERQARVVLARFDGIHSLPGNLKALCQVCLRPFTLGAKNAKPILHTAKLREAHLILSRQQSVRLIAPSWHSLLGDCRRPPPPERI